MNKQDELDMRYLRMARIWSENSYAIRRQVGALVVKDRMIISDGYNGTPSGFENVCEDVIACDCPESLDCGDSLESETCLHCEFAQLKTKPYVLHAEANAISKLARSGNNSDGATLYVTDEPCLECSKLIIQSGIKRVVYWRDYHDHVGVQLLSRAGIQIKQFHNID